MTSAEQIDNPITSVNRQRPRLVMGHSTLSARNMDNLISFYRDVLGFEVTNRGPVPDGSGELAFLSQDPNAHHQIAMVSGASVHDSDFVMIDHLAFQAKSLDDLRIIRTNLVAAGIEEILNIDHGNAWSLYFNDPEGNGVECYIDTPFHVAQPYAGTWDVGSTDAEIEATTRKNIENEPEFQLMSDWSVNFARCLDQR